MPYNNTPIPPVTEFTGSVSLPLARIKKIINADDDIGNCSNNAAFTIAVATEMFIHHLVEQTHNIVKSERRPRRNLQYKDVASAIARIDNLEFLADVVPRTMTYKAFKEKKAAKENGINPALAHLQNGQRTLEDMTGAEADYEVGHDGGDAHTNGNFDAAAEDYTNSTNGNGHVYGDDEDEDEEDDEGASSVPQRNAGRAAHAGQFYDAVKDEFDTLPDTHTPMEE